MINRVTNKAKQTYNEYPSNFWIVIGASFIDRLGGTMLFPFFALYITDKFNVGMKEAGIAFAISGGMEFIGSMLGGAVADKVGRKSVVIFGLVASALSSLAMAAINDLNLFYAVVVVVGLLSSVGHPARQAMLTDILPDRQREDGFGMMRVVMNVAWVLGPSIGGFLSNHAYLYVFIADAVTSIITATIVLIKLPETRPAEAEHEESQSLGETLAGYLVVLRDGTFMGFIGVSLFMLLAYSQLYSTLSVYLNDVHGLPPSGYGTLMSFNALTVVLVQFWLTRRIKDRPPLLMMALGALLYLVGFTMYGFVSAYLLFLVAMIIVTFGEMVVMPVASAFVSRLAPRDMRGRYMSIFGLTWHLPGMIAPYAAGVIMETAAPQWVWYAAGICSAVSVIGFVLMNAFSRDKVASLAPEGARPETVAV